MINRLEELEEEFYIALQKSIDCADDDFIPGKVQPYYSGRYLEAMNELFEKQEISSLQKRRLNALASSARLAFHDYRYKEGAMFEKNLSNDLTGRRGSTEMDVVDGMICYECKCREILQYHKVIFEERYTKDSDLFKEFGCKTSAPDEKGMVSVRVESMGIVIPENHPSDKWRFEIKQLICHLIAIANERKQKKIPKKKPTFLQYVFYTPSEKHIEKSGKVEKMYEELKTEIQAIRKSERINAFCDEHGIIFEEPIFRDVSEIEDRVHKQVFG